MERLWEWADDNDISDEVFPRDKEGLVNLTSLAIGHSKITKIPKEIGNLTNLTWLYLRDAQLTELPKEIGNLTNLTELYLKNNQLTELPKEIGNLTNLTRLSLSYNPLTKLPKEIVNLTNLRGFALYDDEDVPPWDGNTPMNKVRDELSKEQEEWFHNVNNFEETKEELIDETFTCIDNINSKAKEHITEDKEAKQKQASDIFHRYFDPWLHDTLENYGLPEIEGDIDATGLEELLDYCHSELTKLLNYCQSDGRVCPFPNEWQIVWNRLPGAWNRLSADKKRQSNNPKNNFPPTPLVLAGWNSSPNQQKRKHLLVQIYWASIHGGFDKVSKYLMELEDSKWYMPGSKDWDYNGEVEYMSLDDVKWQYELMKKQG